MGRITNNITTLQHLHDLFVGGNILILLELFADQMFNRIDFAAGEEFIGEGDSRALVKEGSV